MPIKHFLYINNNRQLKWVLCQGVVVTHCTREPAVVLESEPYQRLTNGSPTAARRPPGSVVLSRALVRPLNNSGAT